MKERRLAGKWWLLLLLLPLGWGLARLQLDTQVLNLLPAELPSVRGVQIYEEHFANANELLLALQGEESQEVERAARELALRFRAATNLVRSAVWTPPWEENPSETAELMAYLWLNQPPDTFQSFVAQFAATNVPLVLEEAKNRLANSMSPEEIAKLSYDPFGFLDVPGESAAGFGTGSELFSSPDGKFRIIFVQARQPLRSFRDCQLFMQQVQGMVQEWRHTNPVQLTINYTGRPAFVTEISGHMERDIQGSVLGTLLIICGLFWWAHRRFKPLLWLVFLLLLILAITLAAGGFLFARLNIISVGFAAILLGLAVDYGLVLYQEWVSSRGETQEEVRRAVAPSIIWSAVTTAAAFLILNLSGLPGLAQLGTLVGIGLAVAAVVMLLLFLSPFRAPPTPQTTRAAQQTSSGSSWPATARALTYAVFAGGLIFLWFKPPRVNGSAEALRPAHSEAYSTLEQIKENFRRLDEPLWLIASGTTWEGVGAKLDRAKWELQQAEKGGFVQQMTLPGAVAPRPERQKANVESARGLIARGGELTQAAVAAGFTTNSTVLMNSVLDVWKTAAREREYYLPQQTTGRWILQRMISESETGKTALGIVQPTADGMKEQRWMGEVSRAGVLLASWELLGAEVFQLVAHEMWLVGIPMGLLVLASLALAFRRIKPILFSLFALLLSGILLSVIMVLAGWEWNLLNLMSLPLLMGAGLDYSLHVQLSLRRHTYSIPEMRRSVGRALLLCAASTIAGFGSLSWAGNAGLASMGKICAAGIASTYFVAVWLLPYWAKEIQAREKRPSAS